MSTSVMITILTNRVIPFLNIRGPISAPISVDVDVATNLKKLGFEVVEHDKESVTTDRNGLRTLRTDFVSRNDVQDVDKVELDPPAVPEVITPNPTETSLEPTPESQPVEEVLEEVPEESTEEESTEEDTSLVVYELSHYNSWTKRSLVAYLNQALEYLPEEVVAELDSMSKNELLNVITTHIIPLAK